jgi:hypothetical protein
MLSGFWACPARQGGTRRSSTRYSTTSTVPRPRVRSYPVGNFVFVCSPLPS